MIFRLASIFGLAVCATTSAPLFAQREQIQRMPYADYRSTYLGLQIGAHTQGIRLFNSGTPMLNQSILYAEQDAYRLGLSIGLVGGWVLQPNWELRAMPTLNIGEKHINYSDGKTLVDRIQMNNSSLSLPLQIKWASVRENNIRPYIALGPYIALNLNNKKSDVLRAKALEWGVHASLGCDLYLGYVKLSPELSYSYAYSSAIRLYRPELMGTEQIAYTSALSASRNHQITLSLYFQ